MTDTVLVLVANSKEHLNELSPPSLIKEYLDFLFFSSFSNTRNLTWVLNYSLFCALTICAICNNNSLYLPPRS